MADDTAVADAPSKKKRDAAARQPAGQTTAGEDELGKLASDDFERPRTVADPLGTAVATTTDEDKKEKKETPDKAKKLAKALGKKSSDILGYNEKTGVIVTSDGGKYQVSKNGKAIRHLAGPRPPEDIDARLVDARVAGPFTGTAAAINASVHEGTPADGGEAALRQELEDMENRKAEILAELGEEDEEDDEDSEE